RSPKTRASGSTSGRAESPGRCSQVSTRACWSNGRTPTSRKASSSTPTRIRRSKTRAARPRSSERWARPSRPTNLGGDTMAENHKVVVNLATGLEDAERVTCAFLVGGAAVEQGKQVAMFLTKEAVRLALPGYADAVACEGCPPLAKLFEQYANGGELLACPVCFKARKLDESGLVGNARIAGATPLWEWIGEGATVFSY